METAVQEKPEEKKENQVITLEQIEPSLLPELQGWKQKQKQIVEENPFIKVEDNKSWEEGKKRRTALVTARTTIQNQDKLIASKLKEIRSKAGEEATKLIAITLPHEEKQQEEVKRYEAEKEAERLEKERIDNERKEKIQAGINKVYENFKKRIQEVEFNGLEILKKEMAESIDAKSEEDLEEYEMDFAEKSRLLNDQLSERSKFLTEREEARIEKEKLQKEREEYEAKKLKDEQERKAEEARKEEARKAEEAKKEKEIQEALDKKMSEFKGRLEENGYTKKSEHIYEKGGYSVTTEILKSLNEREFSERIKEVDENISKDAELAELRQAQAKAEAEKKAKEEAEAQAKAEAEEKARKEAEANRLKALQPDKKKLTEFLGSLEFTMEAPDLKDKAAEEFLVNATQKITKLQNELLKEAEELK